MVEVPKRIRKLNFNEMRNFNELDSANIEVDNMEEESDAENVAPSEFFINSWHADDNEYSSRLAQRVF